MAVSTAMTGSESVSTDTEEMTDRQYHSYVGDGGHDLKRAYEEILEENQRLREAEERRKRRRPKRSDKGIEYKTLDGIKECDRLNEHQECAIGKMTRMKVWPDMKYYIVHYRKDLLEMSYMSLGIKSDMDKEKYADHIVFNVDKKLQTHTHNNVGYIKRQVCNGGEDGGK